MDLHIAVIADMAVFSYLDAAEEPGEEGKHDSIRLTQNWFHFRNWALMTFDTFKRNNNKLISN